MSPRQSRTTRANDATLDLASARLRHVRSPRRHGLAVARAAKLPHSTWPKPSPITRVRRSKDRYLLPGLAHMTARVWPRAARSGPCGCPGLAHVTARVWPTCCPGFWPMWLPGSSPHDCPGLAHVLPGSGPCGCPGLAHVTARVWPTCCPGLAHVVARVWPTWLPGSGPCGCPGLAHVVARV
jgi:hypothetical protein